MDAPAVNPHRIEYLTSKARLLAGSKRLCGDIYAWAASAEDMLLDLADALQHLHSMVSPFCAGSPAREASAFRPGR